MILVGILPKISQSFLPEVNSFRRASIEMTVLIVILPPPLAFKQARPKVLSCCPEIIQKVLSCWIQFSISFSFISMLILKKKNSNSKEWDPETIPILRGRVTGHEEEVTVLSHWAESKCFNDSSWNKKISQSFLFRNDSIVCHPPPARIVRAGPPKKNCHAAPKSSGSVQHLLLVYLDANLKKKNSN